MARVRKRDNNKCRERCGDAGTPGPAGRNAIWPGFRKHAGFHGAAIPLPGIYPREMKTRVHSENLAAYS